MKRRKVCSAAKLVVSLQGGLHCHLSLLSSKQNLFLKAKSLFNWRAKASATAAAAVAAAVLVDEEVRSELLPI